MQYWEVNNDGLSAKMVYQKKIKDKLSGPVEEAKVDFTEYAQHADSSAQLLLRYPVKPVNNFHKVLFGEHNRKLYLEKYPFPVLDLN